MPLTPRRGGQAVPSRIRLTISRRLSVNGCLTRSAHVVGANVTTERSNEQRDDIPPWSPSSVAPFIAFVSLGAVAPVSTGVAAAAFER
jgi:hypothetical protein